MTTDADPRKIAQKLGKAQRRVVLALSSTWGPSGGHAAAKRLLYRQDIRFCSTIGIAVMIAGRYVLSA
jgi:hypothetical protein